MQTVCNRFKLDDFKKYVRLYCILDTLLLACVFCNYRGNSIKNYFLDPLGCPTIASYSWQCFLYKSKACVEFITDPSMLQMIRSGIRGGPSLCTQKIVTANNEDCARGYDSTRPREYLLYVDLNSMYASCMTKKFPVGEYRWMSEEEISKIDWASNELGSDNVGYILEVDLEYTHSLMDKTSWLPLAPQKRRVLYSELGSRQKQLLNTLDGTGKQYLSQPKMVLDCSDKCNYVLHYNVLRFYIQMGMKLKKFTVQSNSWRRIISATT